MYGLELCGYFSNEMAPLISGIWDQILIFPILRSQHKRVDVGAF